MARVLIVDDASLARRIMRRTLTAAGHEVVAEASDGYGALREYEQCKPDIVMMDVTMPELDGVAASKQLLEIDPTARVIIVTSINRETVVQETIKHGVAAYVIKPYQGENLIRAIDEALD